MKKIILENVILECYKGEKNGKKFVLVKVFDIHRTFLGQYFVNGSLVDRFE